MKRKVAMVLLTLTMIFSLSACGKDKETNDIKKIEASNAAESKEPTDKKYADTNKEPVVAPDKNNNSVESTEDASETIEEETVDTSGILGYWSDDLVILFNSSMTQMIMVMNLKNYHIVDFL